MTNEQVITAWINGKSGKSANGNLSTDGDILKSYALTIGFTTQGALYKVVYNYTAKIKFPTAEGDTEIISGRFYSMTTSSHVGMASAQADGLFAPPHKNPAMSIPDAIYNQVIWTS